MKSKIILMFLVSFFHSQVKRSKLKNFWRNLVPRWTNFNLATTDYNEATSILTGVIIQRYHLITKKHIPTYWNDLYVTNKATYYRIRTVIRDQSCGTLVITRFENNQRIKKPLPIVFTSNNPSYI
jgi:hypothetical protein